MPAHAVGTAVLAVLLVVVGSSPATTAAERSPVQPPHALRPSAASSPAWVWPLASFRIAEPYVQPAHPYAPGHRGIDLESGDEFDVRSPDDGVVAFAGVVAGRPVVTIDHGRGLVSTLEPVETDRMPGDLVARGDLVGRLAVGGHARPGDLHLGARQDGEYVNPLSLLGGIPRAVLLPCC